MIIISNFATKNLINTHFHQLLFVPCPVQSSMIAWLLFQPQHSGLKKNNKKKFLCNSSQKVAVDKCANRYNIIENY